MAKKKYTKVLIDKICKSIAEGTPTIYAVALSGISSDTFYTWLNPKDENNPLTEDEQSYISENIKRAEAERVQSLTRKIIKASDANWQAAAWYLERVHPEEFAKKEQAGNTDPQLPQPQTERDAEISAILLKKYYDLKRKNTSSDSSLT